MIHQAKSDPQLLDEQLASAISAIGTFATCRRHSEYVCLAVKTGSDHDKSSGEGILTMRLACYRMEGDGEMLTEQPGFCRPVGAFLDRSQQAHPRARRPT